MKRSKQDSRNERSGECVCVCPLSFVVDEISFELRFVFN